MNATLVLLCQKIVNIISKGEKNRLELFKLSLPLRKIEATDKGTIIIGADDNYGLVIEERGSPLGKYKDSEITISSTVQMEFYDSMEHTQTQTTGYFKNFFNVVSIEQSAVGKDEVYTVKFVSESTEADFFKEIVTLTTQDKSLIKKLKYGQFIMTFGGVINA